MTKQNTIKDDDMKNGKADRNAEGNADGAPLKRPYVQLYDIDNVAVENLTEQEIAQADSCIEDILAGRAQYMKDQYPVKVVSSTGWSFLPGKLLLYFLESQVRSGFDCEQAIELCNILIKRTRWVNIYNDVDIFLEDAFCERWFDVDYDSDPLNLRPECTLRPGITAADCDEQLLRFVCYIAVCHKAYGASFGYISIKYYLDMVSQIHPDMVNSLKKHGTGNIPVELAAVSNDLYKARANDAFATLNITALADTAACYEGILQWMCSVIAWEGFPHSYSIEFKGTTKLLLPVKGLPQKGINQLFACSARFTELHPLLEHYARLAMREYETYTCISHRESSLPGSFAVFALGMADTRWIPLVCDYLKMCDDEHSSLQVKFVRDMLLKWGLNSQTVDVLVYAVLSTKSFPRSKALEELVACRESLEVLIEVRSHLADYLAHIDGCKDEDTDNGADKGMSGRLWDGIKCAIWGSKALKDPVSICSKAPEELIPLYSDLLL